MIKWIWIQNKRYYYHSTYAEWEDALKQAKRFKRKKNKYFIQRRIEDDTELFDLYLSRTIVIFPQ